MPTGMLLAPIGNPEPRDASRLPARSVLQNASHFEVSTGDPPPSGHPHIFLENGTQTVKMQFDTFPQKIQNRCNLHPCEDENYSGFHFAAIHFLKKDLQQFLHCMYDITAGSHLQQSVPSNPKLIESCQHSHKQF